MDAPNIIEDNDLRFFEKITYSPLDNLQVFGEYTHEKKFRYQINVNNAVTYMSPYNYFLNYNNEQVKSDTSELYRFQSENVYNALNIYAKYDLDFDRNNFNFTLGYDQEENRNTNFSGSRYGLIDPSQPTFELATDTHYDLSDYYGDWAVLGYFVRMEYNYDLKYFVTANLRYDGSSRFAQGSRYVWLPSFSAGWNIAREDFMDGLGFINSLKLRFSWGEIGNQQTPGLYPTIPGYTNRFATFINLDTGKRYFTVEPAGLVNADFTWEKVRTKNLGLDVSMFGNKLKGSFNIYERQTLGMLAEGADLPSVLGTSAPFTKYRRPGFPGMGGRNRVQ